MFSKIHVKVIHAQTELTIAFKVDYYHSVHRQKHTVHFARRMWLSLRCPRAETSSLCNVGITCFHFTAALKRTKITQLQYPEYYQTFIQIKAEYYICQTSR